MNCDHKLELRRRRLGNGILVVGRQCLECGTWGGVKKSSVTNIDSLPWYEERRDWPFWSALRVEAEQKQAQIAAAIAEQNEAWWRWYGEYLGSPEWGAKRQAVLARAGGVCEAQATCTGSPATQVHHITYKHVGNEPLWELKAVCEPCHELITKLDRESRDRPRR